MWGGEDMGNTDTNMGSWVERGQKEKWGGETGSEKRAREKKKGG